MSNSVRPSSLLFSALKKNCNYISQSIFNTEGAFKRQRRSLSPVREWINYLLGVYIAHGQASVYHTKETNKIPAILMSYNFILFHLRSLRTDMLTNMCVRAAFFSFCVVINLKVKKTDFVEKGLNQPEAFSCSRIFPKISATISMDTEAL